jgi:hypothetical protein
VVGRLNLAHRPAYGSWMRRGKGGNGRPARKSKAKVVGGRKFQTADVDLDDLAGSIRNEFVKFEASMRTACMSTKRKPTPINCAMPNGRPGTLRKVVAYYRRDHHAALVELEVYRRYRAFEDAVRAAALSNNGSGKHPHQWRIPLRVLQRAAERLSRAKGELKRSPNFDGLIRIVGRKAGSIHGIGDLAVYDFALRIGAWLRLKPAKVYLHAGTRQGAKALRLDVRGRASIEMRELPRALRRLEPWEAEDVLCIFKDEFPSILSSQSSSA